MPVNTTPMPDAPPPALKEAVLRDTQGVEIARAAADWDRDVVLMVERVGEARYLQLVYEGGQSNHLELPKQLVFPGDVQNFGKLQTRRVQG
jgi:hypothetical protein